MSESGRVGRVKEREVTVVEVGGENEMYMYIMFLCLLPESSRL